MSKNELEYSTVYTKGTLDCAIHFAFKGVFCFILV